MVEFARELKINDNTVYGWVKKFGTDPEVVANQMFKSKEHQMREMQKRISKLQEENEILKKRCTTSRKNVGKVFVHL
ncbi:transposase [Paenibacillus sp. sgz500958]|uniref:transposase n=1 Tax=Paenibacillus sp. sgz500958 TaxID=3242475 RepID=UPI0036D29C45